MKLITQDARIDLDLTENGLSHETGLTSAIIISLLTDRRARTDDRLPSGINDNGVIPADRRGWVGDALDTNRIGSRLWLLDREKQTEETRRRAISYAREALQWLIDDDIAKVVTVTAEWTSKGRLEALIEIVLANGSTYRTSILTNVGVSYAL
jgi:phage gp46-like protein